MSSIYYRIVDQDNHFVDYYTFQQVPQGRGKPSKWFYSSVTGYTSGATLYPDTTGSIRELLDHLIHMNEKLKQDKQFKIVAVDKDELRFDGRVITDEIKVGEVK